MKNQPMHNWADDVHFAVHNFRSFMDQLKNGNVNIIRMYESMEHYANKLELTEHKMRKRAMSEEGEQIL